MPDKFQQLPLEISVDAVHQRLTQPPGDGERPEAWLIDCREPEEHAFCRIEGATLIPMNQTPDQLDRLREPADRPLVIYCHHGVRSRQVAQYLRAQGCTHAQSMAGGIDLWSRTIDPQVPRY